MPPLDVQLLYFDGCPNWLPFERRLREALEQIGSEAGIALVNVESAGEAERLQFRGSPSRVLNGRDPFSDPTPPVGLTCRVYPTSDGLPSQRDLVASLRAELSSEL